MVMRCTKCILPEGYPGLSFDKNGVCSLCINYRKREYLGGDALKHRINSFLKHRDRNESYDCLLGFSGGRDSSYLLYYLAKVLDLRVVCYSADNGFVPEQTKLNMERIADRLDVKLVVDKHDYLRKCIKHHIMSWISRPSPAMIGMLCIGCRFGIDFGLLNYAESNRVPIIIIGGTPFEGGDYKYNLMKLNPDGNRRRSFIAGYLTKVAANPKWILNCTCLLTQIREYYYHYLDIYQKREEKKQLLRISPFHSYIKWTEQDVVSTIQNELDWEKNPRVTSTWRSDCDIALLKLYLYKKTLGFNDKDAGLSSLVRDGQISRTEALNRLDEEGEIPKEVIKEILDNFGVDYMDLETALGNETVISGG